MMTPEQVIQKIAEVASINAAMANVGGCEMAGMIVSYLAAHPEKVDDFLLCGTSLMIDDERFHWRNGCLTWHANNGSIVSPAELREITGGADQ